MSKVELEAADGWVFWEAVERWALRYPDHRRSPATIEQYSEGSHSSSGPPLSTSKVAVHLQCHLYHLYCVISPTFISPLGSRDRLLVEHRTSDRKVASSNPCRSGGRIFFSTVNFVCLLLFGVCSTPVLPQWHLPKVRVAGYI